MQVPILSGIYSDSGAPDFCVSYPRNLIPVPLGQGISSGYLRPAEGVETVGSGPGACRGGINWDGVLYRVLGTKLCSIASDGSATVLGDVGVGGSVTMDYGFDRLGIASGGNLFYWDGLALHGRVLRDDGRHKPCRHGPDRPDFGQPTEVRISRVRP